MFNPFNLTFKTEGGGGVHPANSKSRKAMLKGLRWQMLDWETAEKEVLDFLWMFVAAVKPRVIVETGTYKGWAALYMQTAYEGVEVFTVEIKRRLFNTARRHAKEHGVTKCNFILGDSTEVHWQDYLGGRKVDLCLVDCWERAGALKNLLPHLRKDAYILFHDGLLWSRKFHTYAKRLQKAEVVHSVLTIDTSRGLTICRKV